MIVVIIVKVCSANGEYGVAYLEVLDGRGGEKTVADYGHAIVRACRDAMQAGVRSHVVEIATNVVRDSHGDIDSHAYEIALMCGLPIQEALNGTVTQSRFDLPRTSRRNATEN